MSAHKAHRTVARVLSANTILSFVFFNFQQRQCAWLSLVISPFYFKRENVRGWNSGGSMLQQLPLETAEVKLS